MLKRELPIGTVPWLAVPEPATNSRISNKDSPCLEDGEVYEQLPGQALGLRWGYKITNYQLQYMGDLF
jgi:hypothetical protein